LISHWLNLTHSELILLNLMKFPITYFVTWILFPHFSFLNY
jgi:hypothetical protein